MDFRKIINDFLPDKMFDAHIHLYNNEYTGDIPGINKNACLEDYYEAIKESISCKQIYANIIPYPAKKIVLDEEKNLLQVSDDNLYEELSKNQGNVGELLVLPEEDEDSILRRIKSPQICGFKCYHTLNSADNTFDLDIDQYLPESAFVVANKLKKVITLHMVKDEALSNENNLKYIINMAKKYPDAVLILAHSARSFASWTGFESVGKLKNVDNVWFDLAAVCEPAVTFKIFKECGTDRVMWGSDYPISDCRGKAVSIADKFYWIYENEHPEIAQSISMWKIADENLMATRQAMLMAELNSRQIEDVFYNNAKTLFLRK